MNDRHDTGLSWLDNRSWREVTREERYFCAELYGAVRDDMSGFIAFLREKYGPAVCSGLNWEVGFEVCFYRDWMHAGGPNKQLSMKRTFDLALFSDTQIVLFEIKANQTFTSKQSQTLTRDRQQVAACTRVTDVQTAGIISSRYTPRDSTLQPFTLRPLVTWKQLATIHPSKAALFKRADAICRN